MMVFIGVRPLPLAALIQAKEISSLAEQMASSSTLRIKIINYPQKQGHSEPGLQQQHLTGV